MKIERHDTSPPLSGQNPLAHAGADAELWRILDDIAANERAIAAHIAAGNDTDEVLDPLNERRFALEEKLFGMVPHGVAGIAAKLLGVFPLFNVGTVHGENPTEFNDERERILWTITQEAVTLATCGGGNVAAPDAGLLALWRAYVDARAAFAAFKEDGTPESAAENSRLERAAYAATTAFAQAWPHTALGLVLKIAFIRQETEGARDRESLPYWCPDSIEALRTAADAADRMVTAGLSMPSYTNIPSIGMTFRQAADEVLALLEASAAEPPDNPNREAIQSERRKELECLDEAIANTPAITIGDVLVKLERLACPELGAGSFATEPAEINAIARDLKIIAGVTAPAVGGGQPADETEFRSMLSRMTREQLHRMLDRVGRHALSAARGNDSGTAPADDADSFADAVAAFEAEAPAALALPQAPTDAMTHAAARAAGITPEQFTSAYAAAVQAFQQERAA